MVEGGGGTLRCPRVLSVASNNATVLPLSTFHFSFLQHFYFCPFLQWFANTAHRTATDHCTCSRFHFSFLWLQKSGNFDDVSEIKDIYRTHNSDSVCVVLFNNIPKLCSQARPRPCSSLHCLTLTHEIYVQNYAFSPCPALAGCGVLCTRTLCNEPRRHF